MKHLQALRYMTGFRCIGPDCEDHCCSGWRINLDHADYARMEALRGQSDVVARLFESAVTLDATHRGEKLYAHLNFRPEGTCYFEEGGLCAIHRDFGEEALSKTCSEYPRMVRLIGETHRLGGLLSCPEAARLCLLHEGAVDLVDADPAILPRHYDVLHDGGAADTYGRCLPRVWRACMSWLSDPGLRAEDGVYLVMYLARKTKGFFHRDTAADPAARLDAALARLSDAAHQNKLLRGVDGGAPTVGAARVIALVLSAREGHARRARYQHFVADLLAGYGLQSADALCDGNGSAAHWQRYGRLKTALIARYGGRVAQYLRHYVVNEWHHGHLFLGKGLTETATRLLLCLAMVKFLLVGHPDLPALLDQPGEDPAALDRLAVAAVQVFSKNIGHNGPMLDLLVETMQQHGLADMADLADLLYL